MRTTFQKTIDVILRNGHNNFAFLDGILLITNGTKAVHKKIIKRL